MRKGKKCPCLEDAVIAPPSRRRPESLWTKGCRVSASSGNPPPRGSDQPARNGYRSFRSVFNKIHRMLPPQLRRTAHESITHAKCIQGHTAQTGWEPPNV